MSRLKLCPTCQYHCPTRGTHVVCSRCRCAARLRNQLATLSVQQRTYLRKLVRNGVSRADAMRLAWNHPISEGARA